MTLELPGPLVLASTSPRRRDLLPLLGVPFEVVRSPVDELDRGDPSEVVVENARRKAASGRAAAGPGSVVVACDTEVVSGGRVLGKPADAAAARDRLRNLSGGSHEVLSGVAVVWGGGERTGLELTTVTFADLGDAEIERYVDSEEWRGRAGGYAIQGLGSALVERVEGDLASVIGLPLRLLARLLEDLPSS